MYEKDEKYTKETETIYVLSMILMNLLMLSIIFGIVWSIYVVSENSDFLQAFAQGKFLS